MSLTTREWALVTGISEGGLGDALVTELFENNLNIIATALKIEILDYLPENGRIVKLELDVTSAGSISAAAEEVSAVTGGKLNLLINNAGYGYMMPLMDTNPSAVAKNFDVNVFGLLAVTQAFFPLLRNANGIVANQCSIAALPGGRQPFIGTYSASKAAVLSLSDTMRVELAPFGVKVVVLVTGDVRSGFWKHVEGAYLGIPESSPYQLIRTKVEAMMRGETNPPGGHPRERWAAEVVKELLRSNLPRYARHGYLARTLWIVSWLIPAWLLDYGFAQASGLGNLKALLRDHDEKKTM